MALNDFRQNFASRPLFTGELGRDLDELERRAGSTSFQNNNNNNMNRAASASQPQHFGGGGGGGGGNFNMIMNNNNGNLGSNNLNNIPPSASSGRTPLAEHHHLGSTSINMGNSQPYNNNNNNNSNFRNNNNNNSNFSNPQVSFVSTPNAPIPPASVTYNQQQLHYNSNNNNNTPTSSYNNNNNSNSSYMTVNNNNKPYDINNNNNSNNNFSSSRMPEHGVRGPSASGAWSLLPPQIPRPLGLQRFLDQQFAPPELLEKQNNNNNNDSLMKSPAGDNYYSPNSTGHGRSSQATRAKSTPSKQQIQQQQQQNSRNNNNGKGTPSKKRRTPAGNTYQAMGDYGLGRGPYAMNSSDGDDMVDFDPIAAGAYARRQQIDNEIAVHSGGPDVNQFASSLGVGTAEAFASKMAAEVARQAATKPPVTADDLQSNNSSSVNQRSTVGPRASEVAIMRRRMERIDDGLARAAMRQQIAQERLRNVVASGLVAEGGAQTDASIMPLDTGAKPRSQFLMDPSAVDPSSIGGSMSQGNKGKAGRGGMMDEIGSPGMHNEADMEAVAKMQMMRKEGLLLMPAVPYEHFKYVAPDLSSSMLTKREIEERARQNPGEAKAEAKGALQSRLDQLQLANEELLVRNRIIPTQPDQIGSNRPTAVRAVDPTSVLGNLDPMEQYAMSPHTTRVPQERVIDSTIDHAGAAYRQPHQRIAAPVGGYGSVTDPAYNSRNQQMAQQMADEESQRWAVAKARNEQEGLMYSTASGANLLGGGATSQLRSQQDDTGLLANAALRTLPSGNQRDAYDARKKWANVSFATPGSKFQGTHMDAISKESRDLYGYDQQ